jgi:flagellar biosynthesis protein FliR
MARGDKLVELFERRPVVTFVVYMVCWPLVWAAWGSLTGPSLRWALAEDLLTGAILGLIAWVITKMLLWAERGSQWPPRDDGMR